jgi:hypothetical protein
MTSMLFAPHQAVVQRADGICVGASMNAPIGVKLGPHCVPYSDGTNCQTFAVQFLPTLDASVYECVPRP